MEQVIRFKRRKESQVTLLLYRTRIIVLTSYLKKILLPRTAPSFLSAVFQHGARGSLFPIRFLNYCFDLIEASAERKRDRHHVDAKEQGCTIDQIKINYSFDRDVDTFQEKIRSLVGRNWCQARIHSSFQTETNRTNNRTEKIKQFVRCEKLVVILKY